MCGCKSQKRADSVIRPYKVQRRMQGCTVSERCCLRAIIKISCGAASEVLPAKIFSCFLSKNTLY